MKAIQIFTICLVSSLFACGQSSQSTGIQKSDSTQAYPFQKSEEQWQNDLSPEEFHVLREKGTERAFTGEFHDHHDSGIYLCGGCGSSLFSSDTKFESGTGWPSFYRPIAQDQIAELSDTTFGWTRIEVVCANCGGHLGHVFNDGPRPTGLRYCINSASLDFEAR